VEQWAKDLRLPKQTRSRILTFYRRQLETPYDEGILLLQLPFEMRCLVAKVPIPSRSCVLLLCTQYRFCLCPTILFFKDEGILMPQLLIETQQKPCEM
jgi:hypothetical protein